MKYKHMVKHNGIFYPAGTEVPVGVTKTQTNNAKKSSEQKKAAGK